MKKKANVRNSSMDILRIIAMLLIIMSHYSIHGGFDDIEITNKFNETILGLARLGNLGVDIFFLLAGYFGVKSTFRISKIIQLETSVIFYSLTFYFIGRRQVDDSITKYLFPTVSNQYWFFSVYILLYIFRPIINHTVKSISKKHTELLIVTMLTIWSLIPTLTGQNMYGNKLIEGIMLYVIGAYLRLYPKKRWKNTKYIGSFLLINSVVLILSYIFPAYNAFNGEQINFYPRNSFLIISIAVALVIIFSNINITHNRTISRISSTLFGVYLIHDHSFMRRFLWIDLFSNNSFANSYSLILHMILSTLLVFMVSSIIELVRKHLFEQTFLGRLDKKMENNKIDIFLNNI